MKRLICFIILTTLIVISPEIQAEEQCNPDYNTVITGVPYCGESVKTSASTIKPDQINTAVEEDNNNNDVNVDSPVILVNPGYNRNQILPRSNYNSYPYTPNYNPRNYQYVPNISKDPLPLEIPRPY